MSPLALAGKRRGCELFQSGDTSGVAEVMEDLINDEGGDISETGHIDNLEQGPFETVCFTADNGGSGEALCGEDVKDKQAQASGGGKNRSAISAGGVVQRVVK